MAESLKAIKAKLFEAIRLYPFDISSDVRTYTIKQVNKLKKFVAILQSTNLFSEQISILTGSILYTTNLDLIDVQLKEGNEIYSTIIHLEELIENLITVLIRVVPEDEKDSINITLPKHINDFKELSLVSQTLHTVLTQVLLNDQINGETKIMNVENGSIKINVKVGTKGVLLIAGLAWAAAVIYKKIGEGKIIEEQVELLKINNFAIKDLQEAQKKQIDLLIETEAKMIQEEHFTQEDAENLERLKFAIKTFSELISKGAEFSPALQAPENVSNLFPNYQNLIGVESRTKNIAGPKDK